MPPSLLKQAERAAQELAGLIVDAAAEDPVSGSRGRDSDPARPQLTPPRQFAAGGAAPHDTVVDARQAGRLLASMMAALQDGSLSKLAFNAQSAAVRDAVRAAGDAKLADEYEAASRAVSAAIDQLAALKDTLAGATGEAAALEHQLAEAEAALAALEPDSPQYQAAMQSRDAWREALTAARTKLDGIKSSVQQQQDHVLALQKKADGLLDRANLQGTDLPNAAVKNDASNIARLLMLMMQLGELMLNTGETRSETQQQLLKVQEDIRVKKLAKDASKVDKELANAETLSKTMGCIGKILGAVITVVSFVGAAFTGGASLALAGIGLALLVADEIHQAVTGNSFMEQAMKPLMNLLQPLLQFVMDKVAGVMESLGVDAQTAKMVAMIAVMVAMVAAAVVLAVTGAGGAIASAVSNVVGKLSSVLTRVLEKTIGKLIPEALKKSISQMAKQMTSAATTMFDSVMERLGLSTDLVNKQVYAQKLGCLSNGISAGKTVLDGGMDIAVQCANLDVARTMADVKFTMSELDLLNDMFARLLEQFKNAFNVSQEFFRHASDAIDQRTSTGAAIAHAVRGARAA